MPGGRPTKYKPEFAEQAQKLSEFGATDMQLAEFFGVSWRTIMNWSSRHPEFFQALKLGKDASNARVERSLYQRATGYTFESEKIFQNGGKIVRAKTVEHMPPDATSMIFWLKNRRPDLWRDKKEVVLEVEGVDYEVVSDAAEDTDGASVRTTH